MEELTKHEKEIVERVERGATMLDERIPEWYTQIDLGCLNMASGSECICGQLFMDKVGETLIARNGSEVLITDGYEYATSIFLDHRSLYYGFTENIGCWEFLAEEWIGHIEKRLANNGYKV
jgi:hypothetical protein